jgi:2-polyprenyl-6-methoxyphenol hydroxylase-like FAD-dependent oxidoreductase
MHICNLYNIGIFKMKKIIIVGAGPVGLWTAIQIKLASPTTNIIMFEKYSSYQRTHNLKIDPNSLSSEFNYNNKHIIDWIKDLKSAAGYNGVFISTQEIETKLKRIAQDLGVKIEISNITEKEKLLEYAHDAYLVVGADGAHSFVRQNIFMCGTKSCNLQYVVELKFKAHQDYSIFGVGSYGFYRTMKILNFLPEERISSEISEDGMKKVTLHFFVDKETFGKFTASFKSPKLLVRDYESLPKKLKEDIITWFAARQYCGHKSGFNRENCAISKINLSSYISEKLLVQEKGKHFILVGDAAGAVPYFRALNCGLICATRLAKYTDKFLKDGDTAHLNKYQEDIRSYINKEISAASVKDGMINVVQMFVKASAAVPWQVVFWTASQQKKINEIKCKIEEEIHNDYTKSSATSSECEQDCQSMPTHTSLASVSSISRVCGQFAPQSP